ncbi:MAG: serine/threonine-protein kinase [Pirellulales bacterium]|nr:serine/threonine-protein kinase [Pirellulales bacterium]
MPKAEPDMQGKPESLEAAEDQSTVRLRQRGDDLGSKAVATAPLADSDRPVTINATAPAHGPGGPASFAGSTADSGSETKLGVSHQEGAQRLAEIWPRIPGYEILERLAGGGQGVVYKACHVALARVVALKVLHSGRTASPDEIMRFRIEAEAIARLQHPHIVQIFDIGEYEGLTYLSLEFVEGGSLHEKLHQAHRAAGQPSARGLAPREAARLVETLARAVHAAHLRGILHRDLKPANVLMAPSGVPKITDFGLAKLFDDQANVISGLAAGRISDALRARISTSRGDGHSYSQVGTIHYMAPEQVWGTSQAREIGPAADIYALGVILYEALCGSVPLRGSSDRETLELVWSRPAPSPREKRSDVPADLEAICLVCLRKDPERRFSSAEALADDLHRFLNDQPVEARHCGPIERLAKWRRRRPAMAALVAVALAGLTLTLGVAGAYHLRLAAAHRRVEENFRQAQANLRSAQDAIDTLLTRSAADRLGPLSASEPVRREMLAAAVGFCRQLAAQHPNDPNVARQAGRAARQVGDIDQLLGNFADAREAYLAAIKQFDAADQRSPATIRELASVYNSLGLLEEYEGHTAAAEDAHRQSLDLWNQCLKTSPQDLVARRGAAASCGNLGLTLVAAGKVTAARDFAEEAYAQRSAIARELPQDAEAKVDLAAATTNLASVLELAGRPVEAEQHFAEAARLLEGLPANRQHHPAVQIARVATENNRAVTLNGLKRPDEAEAAARRAVAAAQTLVNAHPDVSRYGQALADSQVTLALSLIAQDRAAQAEPVLTAARDRYQKLLASSADPIVQRLSLAEILALHATVLVRLDRFTSARETQHALETVLADCEKYLENNSARPDLGSRLAVVYDAQAQLLMERRQPAQAKVYLDEAVRYQEQACHATPESARYRGRLVQHLRGLVRTLFAMGEPGVAGEVAERMASLGPEAGQEAAQVFAQLIPLISGIKGNPKIDENHCRRRALALLETALASGQVDPAKVATDPAWESLANDESFKELIANAQPKVEPEKTEATPPAPAEPK